MARLNLNANKYSACLSLLKAGACSESETEIETESNPLVIINFLLAFKEPDNVLEWLGFENSNLTNLIKFITTVCDNYDELVADYNNLQASKNQDNI